MSLPATESPAVIPDEGTATQVYRIIIKATPQQIWDAITLPEFTRRYFHGAAITITPDGYASFGPDGASWGDAQVLEWDPPHRVVHGWTSLYDPELAEEAESRVTWEITPDDDGTCLLTVIHDRLEGAPRTAAGVAGAGWMGVLSALKTLLETREPLHPTYAGQRAD
ncbi:MAG TPA: SRPBCC domain-containing protein [Lapillicoccus sp.]|nr:SRPBCC domain-containing protein [Lapillicoccus sp.]